MFPAMLLLLLTMFFAGSANRSAAAIQDAFPAVSVRFSQALTEQETKRLAEYLPENTLGISQIAFWTECEKSIKNERNNHETEVNVILFNGEGNLVWPHSFLVGGYPGVGDQSGCAISTELANEIFGGTDVVGLPVLISGTEYRIRGVWGFTEYAAMIQLKADAPVFENMEVLIKTDRDYREAAMDLVRDNQLAPTATINGPVIGALGVLAANLPFYLAGLALIIKIIWDYFIPRAGFRIRLTAALLTAAVALLMCGLHGKFPDYLVPTKWSDFEFWGRLALDYRGQLIELISLVPTSKDIFFRLEILQMGGGLLAGVAAVSAYLPSALAQWNLSASQLAVPMHLIWIGAAWICINRFPVDVSRMYLLCCPFLILPILQFIKSGKEVNLVVI